MSVVVRSKLKEEIITLLKEENTTQTKLATQMGVSKSYISKFLAGEIKPRGEFIDKIGKALSLDTKRVMKLKIYSGIVPEEVVESLSNDRVLEFYSRLAESSLSEHEKETLREDINAVTNFLIRVLGKGELKEK